MERHVGTTDLDVASTDAGTFSVDIDRYVRAASIEYELSLD
jgi:hypothetical protein